VVGLFSKNVQQCAAIYTPLMLIIAFVPFLATFNEGISTFAQVIFTYHIFMIFADAMQPGLIDSFNLAVSLGAIGASIAVFGILFALAYKKKGLKG